MWDGKIERGCKNIKLIRGEDGIKGKKLKGFSVVHRQKQENMKKFIFVQLVKKTCGIIFSNGWEVGNKQTWVFGWFWPAS